MSTRPKPCSFNVWPWNKKINRKCFNHFGVIRDCVCYWSVKTSKSKSNKQIYTIQTNANYIHNLQISNLNTKHDAANIFFLRSNKFHKSNIFTPTKNTWFEPSAKLKLLLFVLQNDSCAHSGNPLAHTVTQITAQRAVRKMKRKAVTWTLMRQRKLHVYSSSLFMPPGRKPRVSARTFAQYATHGVKAGLGWGGDDDVPCTCTHGRCYASHGVGCGVCTCTHGRCYASHGVGWGGHDNVPCTCRHGRCYATDGVVGGVGMMMFLHLHTRVMLRNWWVGGGWGWWCSLHLHTCVMLRNWWVGVGGDDDVPCTCTPVWCYAADGWAWVGMIMFLALAHIHMCDATQLMGGGGWGWWWCSLHLHACVMLRNWWVGVGGDDDVPCACTHVWCYATDGWGWVGMMMFSLCGTQVAKMWHKRNQRVKFQRRCRQKQTQLKKGPTGG